MANNHPYAHAYKTLESEGKEYAYFSLPALGDERVERLPYSIRILLESVLRNCDEFKVTKADVEKLLNWKETSTAGVEIPYKPGRVLLQDFTGVPAVVDLAAMRDAMQRLGGDPQKINPLCPVDLVIDHSVQVDVARSAEALARNQEIEFDRNKERFAFLKWATKAFDNMLIVPPGSGIVHQVNLEYLARGVLEKDGVVYPDSLVGTDSHTTMIDGLGICGWGVGGIEAESVMLGQPISMVVPEVVGYELTGRLREPATATDLVLTITENLRKLGVVGKFVEFYGDGVACLSIADRATIANMAPEQGATMSFFPCDQVTLAYYRQTGRDEARVRLIEKYMESQEFLRNDGASKVEYSTTLSLDLGTVVPCVSGPKRPHDRIEVTKLKEDFDACMTAPGGFKGFGIPEDHRGRTASFTFDGKDYTLKHGDVVIAAITSCTNTSNPDVMVAAALLARNARARGLTTLPYIKTSLSPGSGVVTEYLSDSGLLGDMEALGFNVAGYGCMTCIGNSGDLDPSVANAIDAADIVASAVLSGNRNFEGRVHPQTRANYLASPPLVVAYALAGTVRIDFDNEPIGNDTEGKPVFLRDIWPSNAAVAETVANHLNPDMFRKVYGSIQQGTERWNSLASAEGALYQWDPESTYINNPPFFSSMNLEPKPRGAVHGARCLALLGSSITTDHISPAGRIAKNSAAAAYLQSRGVAPADFNTYGARRGHDEVMARGTFSNIRLRNLAATSPGPVSVHVPSGEEAMVCDVAFRYRNENTPVIVVGGADYGAGSSRDWAAKGPYLLGVRCVIAESFERIHRSNLVGMGIVPLQFKSDENAKSIGLTGKELFDIHLPETLSPGMDITVTTDTGKSFATRLRFDTAVELTYYHHGGILHYVLRQLLGSA